MFRADLNSETISEPDGARDQTEDVNDTSQDCLTVCQTFSVDMLMPHG